MTPDNLQKILKIKFKNPDLLMTALTHRSYLNEHSDYRLDHNERLEFLGDAVLELIVTDYLYRNYPNPEGELTNWRAALVRGATLKEVALVLHLGQYINLSKGEILSGGRERELIMANTVEALIGAIYIDRGIKYASQFIHKYIITRLPQILAQHLYQDAKSRLQEKSQEKLNLTPTYYLISQSGPDHAKQFVMGVKIGDNEYGQGSGLSKQEAEQNAAAEALSKWEEK
ncbi:MAG: ribonuclease III [Patescibacteria group bacterium]